MTQSIEYVVKVGGAAPAAAQVKTVEDALARTEVQAHRAGTAIDTAVKPTRNLGQAGLEASRAIEDLQYGIGGVVNNIPSLVMALGGGAGLTAAISLAAVGVNQLYKNFTAIPDATETATTTARKYIEDLRGEIADLGKELRLVQVGATRVAAEEQRKRIQIAMVEAKAAIEAVGGAERLGRLRELTGDDPTKLAGRGFGPLANRLYVSPEAFKAAIDAQTKIDLEIRKMQQLQLIELEKADKKAREDAEDEAKKSAEDLAKARYDLHVALLESEDNALREVAKSRKKDEEDRLRLMYDMHVAAIDEEDDALEKVRDARRRDRLKAEKDAARERVKVEKKANKEIEQAAKATTDYQISLAADAFGQMTGGLMDYVDAKVRGEEHAEQKAIASFLSATGQQLVASGTRGIMEGAILSSNPLTPGAGAGMIATGAAAIGVGLAMAGGGAALASAVPSGAMSASGATRDPGASPRTTSSTGSGGPMIINVSYGAGGPLPEDVAREIHRVVRSGDRRSGR